LPSSFKPSPVGENDRPEAALFTFDVISFIDDPTGVIINSISVLLPLLPVSVISVSIGVLHLTLAMLQIVLPGSLIDISVSIAVFPMAMLPVLNRTLIALTVFEHISAVDKGIVLPLTKVHVSVTI